MIRPAGFRGAAFGTARNGDARTDAAARAAMAGELEIPTEWAYPRQVHGRDVLVAVRPGPAGDGDAVVTSTPRLPVCVSTADCVPVILHGARSAAAVHAGWRGIGAGVVAATVHRMTERGDPPLRAAIGPAVGPCCYEVSEDVADLFSDYVAETSWGTTSVDLPAAVLAQIGGIRVWRSSRCTFTDEDLHSHRRDRTTQRQVAVAWLPTP